MEKVQNCPNNTFDCGVGCGLIIMANATLEILEKIKDDKTRKKAVVEFRRRLHGTIHEKHLEHMDNRYIWQDILDKIIEEI